MQYNTNQVSGQLTPAQLDTLTSDPRAAKKMMRGLAELKRGIKAAPSSLAPLLVDFARRFVSQQMIAANDVTATVLEVLPHADLDVIEHAITEGTEHPITQRFTALATDMLGEPLSSQANVLMCVQNTLEAHPDIIVNNVRAQRLWVCRNPPWAPDVDGRLPGRPLDETDFTQICLYLAHEYRVKHATSDQVSRAIKASTCMLDQYDPIREYLLECRATYSGSESDARELLETLLIKHAGADDTPLTRAVTRCWFLIAVERALLPGCIFRQVLTLVGKQRLGKSTFFASLVPEQAWYLDDVPIDRGNDNVVRKLRGKWIAEFPEVDKLLKQDRHGEVKSFVSTRTDTIKPLWAEHAVDRPRDFVFGASTNEEHFFSDPTGSTRFTPVRVERIDHEAIAAIRDEIWGAAAVLLLNYKAQPFLTDIEHGLAETQQAQHYIEPAELILLDELVNGPVPTCQCLECIASRRGDGTKEQQCARAWHPDQKVPEGYLRATVESEDVEQTEKRLAWVGTTQIRKWLLDKGERTPPQKIASAMRQLGWVQVNTPRQYRGTVGRRAWCHPEVQELLQE